MVPRAAEGTSDRRRAGSLVRLVAVILARGGSKGIPRKNLVDFAGAPLLSWTIRQCSAGGIEDIHVSSDDEAILEVAEAEGAGTIQRPSDLSGDTASSESGWLHALDVLEAHAPVDWLFAPQVTSPLRRAEDVRRGIELAGSDLFDSIFSSSPAGDLMLWQETAEGLAGVNHDPTRRLRRQDVPPQHVENGSFYVIRPSALRTSGSRFSGRIGHVPMAAWQTMEIDDHEDLLACEALFDTFRLAEPDHG